MKELLSLLVLVSVLGIGGFLYRNALEHPGENTDRAQIACTLEARMCPDGTAVGRTGRSCEFAACPFPNVELGNAGVAYVMPDGFISRSLTPADPQALIAAYVGSELAGAGSSEIRIYRYVTPEGQTANDVALSTAIGEDGTRPDSMLRFSPVIVNGTKVETIDLGEGERALTAHYLLRETDVIRFDAIDIRTEAATSSFVLPAQQLPAHRALVDVLLSSLQTRD